MVESLIDRRRQHWIEETYKEYVLSSPKYWHKAALALALTSGRTRQTLHGKNTFEAASPVTETSKKELLINGVRIPTIIPAKEWVELYNILPASAKQLTPKDIADLKYDEKLIKVYKYLEIYDETDVIDFFVDYALKYCSYNNESDFLNAIADNNSYVPEADVIGEKKHSEAKQNHDCKGANVESQAQRGEESENTKLPQHSELEPATKSHVQLEHMEAGDSINNIQNIKKLPIDEGVNYPQTQEIEQVTTKNKK